MIWVLLGIGGVCAIVISTIVIVRLVRHQQRVNREAEVEAKNAIDRRRGNDQLASMGAGVVDALGIGGLATAADQARKRQRQPLAKTYAPPRKTGESDKQYQARTARVRKKIAQASDE